MIRLCTLRQYNQNARFTRVLRSRRKSRLDNVGRQHSVTV
ncbi:hypothetical protein RHOER0001_1404 [Rhodococcus erythropolis SK121]|nr:hypothetical protein RHOER0001_1404 [Rhodococcus erythropolis SK121]